MSDQQFVIYSQLASPIPDFWGCQVCLYVEWAEWRVVSTRIPERGEKATLYYYISLPYLPFLSRGGFRSHTPS